MVRVDGSGNASSLIHVRGLDKKYYRGGEEIDVLQGLNLDVDAGDFVAFMGPRLVGRCPLRPPGVVLLAVKGRQRLHAVALLRRTMGEMSRASFVLA